MPAKRNAPRLKRKALGPSESGKKQTVATKKKHVRELAKSGRWAEIEKLYGRKILVKAKAYAEKNHLIKTPQEIAREILLKNGLLSAVSQKRTAMKPARVEIEKPESAIQGSNSLTNNTIPSCLTTLTKEQHERAEKRRQEALKRRKPCFRSPGTLTKDQQERIEARRREALEKRRRAQRRGTAHARSLNLAQPPAILQSDSAYNLRQNLQSSTDLLSDQLPFRPLSTQTTTSPEKTTTPRVVTPENLLGTNVAALNFQNRPEFFWNDLEAAAEIAQWENEHMAEAALVLSVDKSPLKDDPNPEAFQPSLGQQVPQGSHNTRTSTRTHSSSVVPSISQELAAAAEIIRWENEHKIGYDSPVSLNSNIGLNAPPCKLQENVRDEFEIERKAIDADHLQVNSKEFKIDGLSSKELDAKNKSQRKRPAPAPAQPNSVATFNTASNPGVQNQKFSPSPHQSENRHDLTAEFIEKHLLEDELELPVLEFLEMMLD